MQPSLGPRQCETKTSASGTERYKIITQLHPQRLILRKAKPLSQLMKSCVSHEFACPIVPWVPPCSCTSRIPKQYSFGMNGSDISLQKHTLIYGLTSHAITTGIRPGMLPLYLHIGVCNACYRGILLVLVASAVHDILGNPNVFNFAPACLSAARLGRRV